MRERFRRLEPFVFGVAAGCWIVITGLIVLDEVIERTSVKYGPLVYAVMTFYFGMALAMRSVKEFARRSRRHHLQARRSDVRGNNL